MIATGNVRARQGGSEALPHGPSSGHCNPTTDPASGKANAPVAARPVLLYNYKHDYRQAMERNPRPTPAPLHW